jgi:cysteine synthase A
VRASSAATSAALAPTHRAWCDEAVRRIEADYTRSADTHLLRVDVPGAPGIALYFKDESVHPTGSLKHRLARSLFLYGLANGFIGPRTTVVEASSGSTAVSEAYFARLIGLPFVAVMPRSTSREKIAQIEFHGGRCHLVADPAQVYAQAARLAADCGGHYMDQFTYAERATDWRGNNNIAESIFEQMSREPHPVPTWIVMSAGTGGTTATLGRYIRYMRFATRLCVADPEFSAFFEAFAKGNLKATCERGSRIEGIGRPRVEPSFLPNMIDRMMRVPDAQSLAGMRVLSRLLGRKVGGSTGTNFVALCILTSRMKAEGRTGSLVSLICDSGERYGNTYYNDDWVAAQGLDLEPHERALEAFLKDGEAII